MQDTEFFGLLQLDSKYIKGLQQNDLTCVYMMKLLCAHTNHLSVHVDTMFAYVRTHKVSPR